MDKKQLYLVLGCVMFGALLSAVGTRIATVAPSYAPGITGLTPGLSEPDFGSRQYTRILTPSPDGTGTYHPARGVHSYSPGPGQEVDDPITPSGQTPPSQTNKSPGHVMW